MKLGYYEIAELGNYISQTLGKNGVTSHNCLIINVDENSLRKIDEDLYYRNFPEGKDYTPTEGEINVKFQNLTIQIKATKE